MDISKLLTLFEPLPGVERATIKRKGRQRDIIFMDSPESAPQIAQRRCPGSYSTLQEAKACKVCHNPVRWVIHFTQQGRRRGMVIDEHYCNALRNCAECDGGIWDEHYLCENCR